VPKIPSDQLRVNQPVESAAPDATLVVTANAAQPLPVGAYTFQLEVVDNAGNRSKPVQARVVVVDNQAPTAIISAPRTVPFGTEFTLSGAESSDVGGGTIAKYIWTLIQ
jgi:chitodextrinase